VKGEQGNEGQGMEWKGNSVEFSVAPLLWLLPIGKKTIREA
jgi:hypothetical protein